MNKRRLLKLADLLEKDAKKKDGIKFDMRTWGRVSDEGEPLSCHTKACAMGLAALSGAFKRAGLDYYVSFGELRISFDGEQGALGAAINLFDLTLTEAEWLFMPDAYRVKTRDRAERLVAKRIRGFVAGKVSP